MLTIVQMKKALSELNAGGSEGVLRDCLLSIIEGLDMHDVETAVVPGPNFNELRPLRAVPPDEETKK